MDGSCKEAGLWKGQLDVSRGEEIIPELQGGEGKDAGLCARIH